MQLPDIFLLAALLLLIRIIPAHRVRRVLMTIAGYNPQNAITFWQKMSANSQTRVPEFLSSHPSHETRINDLTKWVPEVQKQYGRK